MVSLKVILDSTEFTESQTGEFAVFMYVTDHGINSLPTDVDRKLYLVLNTLIFFLNIVLDKVCPAVAAGVPIYLTLC